MADDKKKYNGMENLLNKINGDFISISENDKRRNNAILKTIVTQITDKMQEKDNLFNTMFTGIFHGGSFYDGLKVGEPDEYDLDLLLEIPTSLKYRITPATNVPGFVLLQFSEYGPSLKKLDLAVKYKNVRHQHGEGNAHQHQNARFSRRTIKNTVPLCYDEETRGFDKLVNSNHYLEKSKVLHWMESVVNLALNTFKRDNNGLYINTPYGKFYVKISKSGPAFTVKATSSDKQVNMDIDLVPCFEFGQNEWPKGHFRPNPVSSIKPTFFIVPKPIKDMTNYSDHYWRLSFQAQESVLMDGKQKLKPTIKLLKKMRDMLQHKIIASYYIKTVALWTMEEKKNDPNFWNNNSLSYTFMTVLKNYQKSLQNGEILYFWNKTFDLLGRINESTIANIKNRITAVINDIERHPEDPFVVAKYLVTPAELLQLKQRYGT